MLILKCHCCLALFSSILTCHYPCCLVFPKLMLQDQLVLCMHSWYHLPTSCFIALVGAGRGSNYSTGWKCLFTVGMAASHSTPLVGGLGSLALTPNTVTLHLLPLVCKVLIKFICIATHCPVCYEDCDHYAQ